MVFDFVFCGYDCYGQFWLFGYFLICQVKGGNYFFCGKGFKDCGGIVVCWIVIECQGDLWFGGWIMVNNIVEQLKIVGLVQFEGGIKYVYGVKVNNCCFSYLLYELYI